MYEELIDAMRCAYAYATKIGENPYRFVAYYKQAADAIEELSTVVESYRNRMAYVPDPSKDEKQTY